MSKNQTAFGHKWNTFKSYIGWEDFIAIGLIILGVVGYLEGPIPSINRLTDFYMDIRSDLIGIGITVLIIDNVNEMYRRRAEKERLILQMGSIDNGFAVEAVRQLASRGWLYDGSLAGCQFTEADLSKANLSKAYLYKVTLDEANLNFALMFGVDLTEAHLIGANLCDAILCEANLCESVLLSSYLRGADFSKADLSKANLRYSDLSWTDLSEANLNGADLFEANLEGATLEKTNLSGASVSNKTLAKAKLLEEVTMPDGRVYNPTVHTEIANIRKMAGLD